MSNNDRANLRNWDIAQVEQHNRQVRMGRLHKLSANGVTPLSEAAERAISAATVFATKPASAKAPSKPKRKGKLLSVAIFLPIRIHSEANEHGHWAKKAKRAAAQAQEFEVEWYRLTKNARIELPCLVRFTRIGQKRMDDDNLANGFKRLRDALAKALGVDDGSDLIRFEYGQDATGKREYGVRVEVVSL